MMATLKHEKHNRSRTRDRSWGFERRDRLRSVARRIPWSVILNQVLGAAFTSGEELTLTFVWRKSGHSRHPHRIAEMGAKFCR
jgi:hypothetical protein